MANQGHSGEGYRLLCEYIWAGAIGNVTETHSLMERSFGGTGKKVEWDVAGLRCGDAEVNQWVKRTYRKGWEV
jgi:hypothetical protein